MVSPSHIAVLLLLMLPASALAQDTPPPLPCAEYVPAEEQKDPQRLALRGVACFEAGNYINALRHYRRAKELSDSNLLNAALGRTFQELGYLFIAQRYYRDYLSGKIEDSEGRAKIESRLTEVEAKLASESARVRLESSPSGAMMYVVIADGHREPIGKSPMNLQMQPGKHTFIVEEPGYVTHTQQVDVGNKRDRIVRAELVQSGAAFSVPRRRLRRAGIITVGASIPFLIIGPTLYLAGQNQRSAADELPPPDRADATRSGTRMQTWGIAVTVTGIAALGTGIAMYLVGREPRVLNATPDEAGATWAPYVDTKTAGVVVRF